MSVVIDPGDQSTPGGLSYGYFDVEALSDTKFVAAYGYTNDLYLRIGTLSGTTISWGAEYEVEYGEGRPSIGVLDSSHFVLMYRRWIQDTGDRTHISKYSVSGTTISHATSTNLGIVYDGYDIVGLSGTYFLAAFIDADDSDKPKVRLYNCVSSISQRDEVTISTKSCYSDQNVLRIDAGLYETSKYYFALAYATTDGNTRLTIGEALTNTDTLDIDTTDTVVVNVARAIDVAWVEYESHPRFLVAYNDSTDSKVISYHGSTSSYALTQDGSCTIQEAPASYVGVDVFTWNDDLYFLVVYQRDTDDVAMANLGTLSSLYAPSITIADEDAYESSASTEELHLTSLDAYSFIAWGAQYAVPGKTGFWDVALSESGSATDTITDLQIALTISETPTGLDTPAAIAKTFTLIDSGVGADKNPEMTASMVLQDNSSGLDGVNSYNLITLVDAAVAVDLINQLQAAIPVSDVGSGVDVLSALQAALSVVDSGSGGDTPSLQVNLQIPELGTGIDTLDGITVSVPITDIGALVDVLTALQALLNVEDGGTLNDALTKDNWWPTVGTTVSYPRVEDIEYEQT